MEKITETAIATLAHSKSTILAGGLLSFDFLIDDDRVLPIMAIGMIISLGMFTHDFFEKQMTIKPISKLIMKIFKHLFLGAVTMNIAFFAIIWWLPTMPIILVASISALLSTQSDVILNRVKEFIKEFKPPHWKG